MEHAYQSFLWNNVVYLAMKYRSRSEILISMLESARTGTTKTKIMYEAYLSYNQLMEYLPFLQKNNLLIYENGTERYRVTKKGYKFLDLSHNLDDMIHVTHSKHAENSAK
jgi:predicted transcriptional regulator